MRTRTARVLLPALTMTWAGLVLWASLVREPPHIPSVPGAPGVDLPTAVLAHIGLYAVLAGLMVLLAWTVQRSPALRLGLLAAAFAVATLYGGAMELLQAPVPERSASWADAGWNALGALLAVAFLGAGWSWARRRKRLG